jgi:NAD(P)-dependent dehydrogenase (short-subunit alcohol dehydrogenase family)
MEIMKQIAIVTGADRGVGFELTKKLLEKGYTVFAGRFAKDWNLLDTLIEEYKGILHLVDLDVSSDKSVKAAAEYIKSKTDKIDILINNGAILGDISKTVLDELDFEEMMRVYNVNALGSLRMCNAFAPMILNSSTKLIVNISSEAGSVTDSYRDAWFGYCMSKTALNMHTTIAHNELKNHGGQVMAVQPGWVKTYMQGKLDADAELTPAESAEHILKIVFNYKKYSSDKAVFLDHLGNKANW